MIGPLALTQIWEKAIIIVLLSITDFNKTAL